METIGQRLKAARKSKGLTIESLSEQTKINRNFIAAMESDDFGFLPRPYVRGFLKQIAAAVGLDVDTVLAELDSPLAPVEASLADDQQGRPDAKTAPAIASEKTDITAGAEEPSSPPSGSGRKRARKKKPSAAAGAEEEVPAPDATVPVAASAQGKPAAASHGDQKAISGIRDRRFEWILGGAAVVLVLGILLVYAKYTNSVSEEAVQQVEELPLEIALQPEKPIAAPTAAQEPQPETLELQAIADQTTWMRVIIDDSDTSEVILREGEQTSWQATTRFSMRFGNAGGVRLLLNGRELERPGRSGQVVTITVTRDGIVERRVRPPRRTQPDSVAAVQP
jgi:cytoskeleton protein RodZ